MNYSKISVRYAKALFASALEEKKLDRVREDSLLIMKILEQTEEIHQILDSPVLEPSSKIRGLEILFAEKVQVLTMNFLRLVVINHREEHLEDMFRQYDKQYKEHKDIKLVKIRSAHPLTVTEQENILEMVRALVSSKLEVQTEIQKDLIGGFVMQIEDQQIDASISMQLNSIRDHLTGKARAQN